MPTPPIASSGFLKRLANLHRNTLLAIAYASACIASSHAIEFRDIDEIGLYMRHNGPDAQKTYSGSFNILLGDGSVSVTIGSPYYSTPLTLKDLAGFDPDQYSITSATAYFYFRDDGSDNDREEVRVEFAREKSKSDDDKAEDAGDKDKGTGNDYDFSDGTIANKRFTVFSDALNATVLAALEDGHINYEIRADKGDFYFDYARLEVMADFTRRNPDLSGDRIAVPDSGSTVAMMLVGGAGLLALARRFR